MRRLILRGLGLAALWLVAASPALANEPAPQPQQPPKKESTAPGNIAITYFAPPAPPSQQIVRGGGQSVSPAAQNPTGSFAEGLPPADLLPPSEPLLTTSAPATLTAGTPATTPPEPPSPYWPEWTQVIPVGLIVAAPVVTYWGVKAAAAAAPYYWGVTGVTGAIGTGIVATMMSAGTIPLVLGTIAAGCALVDWLTGGKEQRPHNPSDGQPSSREG